MGGHLKKCLRISDNFQALSLKQFYIHYNKFYFNLIDILKVFLKPWNFENATNANLNKEERYSRVPRLSDTRYSKGYGDMQAAKRN